MKKLRYIGDYAIFFITKTLRLNLKKNDTFEVSLDEYEKDFKNNKNFEVMKEETAKKDTIKEEIKQEEVK